MDTVWKNKRVRAKCHIYQMLATWARRKHISLHTPGHKVGKWDITELPYSDNLSAPRGCIAQAQTDIARILGANTAYIITDGSTAGVLSILYTAKTLGVKRVIMGENSHKSAYNGCALFDLTPSLFPTSKIDEIPQPVRLEDIEGLDGDAVLLTSPDYYGNVPDLAAIRAYCERTGKLLLIDGAHGGHLHFDERLYAGKYADLWVDGVHKSLPALTQGAIVCARTKELAELLAKGVDIFRTTSPSYPIMASVEYAAKYPRNLPLINAVAAWKKGNRRLYANADWTKIVLLFGKNASAAYAHLQRTGVYAEFCDGNVVACYLSPVLSVRAFSRIKKRLEKCMAIYPYEPVQAVPAPLVLPICGETEWVDTDEAAGRICAENCGLFPPCTPLILRGERISEQKLALLQNADNVFGLKGKKISVFKTEDKE